MQITYEQKIFIENIIKECHGYEGNEHLLDKICDEVIRRSTKLFSSRKELGSIRVYLKRIVNYAIFEVINNPANTYVDCYNAETINKNADNDYKFNYNDDIAYDYELSFEEDSDKTADLSENKINSIKNIICVINKENHSSFYKNIFELRYIKGFNNSEIAESLNLTESEVDKKLVFMLNRIREEVF